VHAVAQPEVEGIGRQDDRHTVVNRLDYSP
jgi:hypothetical protein